MKEIIYKILMAVGVVGVMLTLPYVTLSMMIPLPRWWQGLGMIVLVVFGVMFYIGGFGLHGWPEHDDTPDEFGHW